MSDIVKYNVLIGYGDYIESVRDLSDRYFTRARVKFKNSIELSIVQGEYSYGGTAGLFEIAIFISGTMTNLLFGEEEHDEDVLGYLTKEQVVAYMDSIVNLTETEIEELKRKIVKYIENQVKEIENGL